MADFEIAYGIGHNDKRYGYLGIRPPLPVLALKEVVRELELFKQRRTFVTDYSDESDTKLEIFSQEPLTLDKSTCFLADKVGSVIMSYDYTYTVQAIQVEVSSSDSLFVRAAEIAVAKETANN